MYNSILVYFLLRHCHCDFGMFFLQDIVKFVESPGATRIIHEKSWAFPPPMVHTIPWTPSSPPTSGSWLPGAAWAVEGALLLHCSLWIASNAETA